MNGELYELILQLKSYTPYADRPRPSALDFINNYTQLVECLEKFNSLVGLQKAKESIARQFKGFVVEYQKSGNPTFGQKLHTLIIGKPGVGKTILGELLAEIWSVSGCIGAHKKSPVTRTLETQALDIQQSKMKLLTEDKNHVARQLATLKTHFNRVRKQFAFEAHREAEMQCLCQQFKKELNQLLDDVTPSSSTGILPVVIPKQPGTVNYFGSSFPDVSKKQPRDKPKFKVVTRGDLIDRYQGGSTAKTRNLLKEYEGGVLMIDEAYLLCGSDHDDFGKEALGEIINYMSRHPEKITFIFAGYREEIEKTILTQQPGLSRRFGWTIDVEDYTPQELSEIFKMQLTEFNLTISDETFEKFNVFIAKNKEHFASFGGDTEKLAVLIKEVITGRGWLQVLEDNPENKTAFYNEVSFEDIELAFDKFKQNSPSSVYKNTKDTGPLHMYS